MRHRRWRLQDPEVTSQARIEALLQYWNDGNLGRVAAQLAPDVVFDARVRRGGVPGGQLLSGRDAFLAGYPSFNSAIRRFELVSVLADEASASLVLRDDFGELLTVLLAFDASHQIRRVTSYRRTAPHPVAGSKAGLGTTM